MQTELHNIDIRLLKLSEELLNYRDSDIRDSGYKRIYEIAEAMLVIEYPIIKYNYAVKNNYLGF